MICLMYVDDCLFFSADRKLIEKVIEMLRSKELYLTRESDVEGFLGVYIQKKGYLVEFKQNGLIERIIKEMDLEYSNVKETPEEVTALGKHQNSDPSEGIFNYTRVVGMLLYLQGLKYTLQLTNVQDIPLHQRCNTSTLSRE